MSSIAHAAPVSNARRWTARILTSLAVLFLLFDAIGKVLLLAPVLESSTSLGYPAGSILWIGLIELVCLVLYVIPRTSVLGAVLLTGYLGGAVATHVRLSNPFATHIFFPIYIALLYWGGLYLRDDRLRALFPIRK